MKSMLPKGRALKAVLTASTSAAMLAMATAGAHALPSRDDHYADDNSVDTANVWSGVGMMLADPGFVCTGQLINPRTVIFAAHCVDSFPDAAYGAATGGAGIAFGFQVDTRDALLDWFFSADRLSNPDELVFNVLQVQTVFDAPNFEFPGGDVAMATLDTPAIGLPTYGMLFSPVTETSEVSMVGYGTHGNGTNGADQGIDWKRRAGNNMLDGLFTQDDFITATFAVPSGDALGFFGPSAGQLLYHVDFDRPDRIEDDCGRGTVYIGPNDYTCNTPPFTGPITWDFTSVFDGGDHINWFGGDALDQESGTAGGDSGSGLFLNVGGNELILGVLSGGWTFTSPNGGYGDLSYYNPLFLYQNWIVGNNPYVHATANAGDGNWSDASHWSQALDPNYFVLDEDGNAVNGINPDAPVDEDAGLAATDPAWGTILDREVNAHRNGDYDPAPAAPAAAGNEAPNVGASNFRGTINTGFGSAQQSAGILQVTQASQDARSNSIATVGIDDMVTYDDGIATVGADDMVAYDDGMSTVTADSAQPRAAGDGSGLVSTASPLVDGTWVPNNDWNGFATDWTNPTDGIARFYNVALGESGTTTVDIDVQIDSFAILNNGATLEIGAPRIFESLISFNQSAGTVNNEGLIATREYVMTGGLLTGEGAILTDTFWNIAGAVSPGATDATGELTIFGDYVQSAAGRLVMNIGPNGDSDFLDVFGDISLDGNLTLSPVAGYLPRYGDAFTLLDGVTVIGGFSSVTDLPGVLTPSLTLTNGTLDLELAAVAFNTQAEFTNGFQDSLGASLDGARDTDYAALSDIYGQVDLLQNTALTDALDSLSPFDAVIADRGVRTHTDTLSRALRNHIGDFNDASGLGGGSLMAELKDGGAMFADRSIGTAAYSAVKAGHGHGHTEARFRLFGDYGVMSGQVELLNPTTTADIDGSYALIGGDIGVGDWFRIGASAAMADSDTDGNASLVGTTGQIETTQFNVFATMEAHHFHGSASIGMSDSDISSSRVVSVGGLVSALGADYSADGTVYDVQIAYDLRRGADGWRFAPFAGITGSEMDFDEYTTIGNAGAQTVAGRSYSSSILRFGAMADIEIGNRSTLELYGAYANEMGDGTEFYAATFNAAPTVGVSSTGMEIDTEWVEYGASFTTEVYRGATIGVNAESTAGGMEYMVGNVVSLEITLPF